jgi:putative oxidoreductase
MNAPRSLGPLVISERWLDLLQPVLALFTRLYVSWQFLQSGWLKLTSWSTTLDLFANEYHVPVLPPAAAAVAGTFGELFFPVLIVLGLGGRLGPLGLFAVNLMAVVSYAHVLLAEGFEAALAQHVLWGFMLAMLAVYGNGPLSVDQWLKRRAAGRGAMG